MSCYGVKTINSIQQRIIENDKENGFYFTVHCTLWGDGRKSMYPGEADRAWSFLLIFKYTYVVFL